ncbi:MAG TPA: hypothetical protein VKR99_07345 [Candidatus Eremiobacteraceae bacterium]|nr:hypothetical protein [Candidatus Eremiobacteraceae bacterium]
MSGIKVFKSVAEAQAAGFAVYDRIPDGYLVRKSSGTSFALAIVKLVKDADGEQPAGKESSGEREPANRS